MVSDALIQEVREKADILEVLSEFVPLKRSGRTWRGPCPLHGGEGPNFSVDPSRGIFKCFVCGEGGDVFSFLMKHLGLDFPEAVRQVAARVGVEIPDGTEDATDPWDWLREVTAFADEWFRARLEDPGGEAARAYLADRGVSLGSARDFGLGWAPDGWRGLRDAAHARGIGDEALLEAGLLATSERAEEPYDRFRARLIFSIHDLRGRPVAFGGRVVGTSDERVPKYINSPESPIFHKGRTLYALSRARHEIRRAGVALVVEGYMDALSLHVGGFPTAVAPLGTALTDEQATLLARYARKALLLYDSDAAGLRATFRAGDELLAAGVHPMVVTLPGGEDPDSLLRRHGAAALSRLLEDAVDLLERKLQILERKGFLESIEGKRRAVDGVLSTLRAVRDPALRDIYLGRAAERIGVRRETLVEEVARSPERPRALPRPGRGRVTEEKAQAEDEDRIPDGAERSLLLLLQRDPELTRRARERGLRPEHFRHPVARAVYEVLERRTRPAVGEDGAPASETGSDARSASDLPAPLAAELERLAEDSTEVTHPGEVYEETLRRVLYRGGLERLAAIDRELEMAEEDQARRLLEEKARIARELREAGVPLSFLRSLTGGRATTAGR